MPTVCVDWDDTLVGYRKYGTKGEWLPGAEDALRALIRRKADIVIHSCRGSFLVGQTEIREKLQAARLNRHVEVWSGQGKPIGMAYVDDRAVPFAGDWDETLDILLAKIHTHNLGR